MRLTLRALLNWINNILPPDDAELIAQKVAGSDLASALKRQIEDVMRKTQLAAPTVLDGTPLGNPNTAAEYLDNVLSSEMTPEFEKFCLNSEIILGEIACCHQILSEYLTESTEVDPSLRNRMHTLFSLQDQEAVALTPAVGGVDIEDFSLEIPPTPEEGNKKVLLWAGVGVGVAILLLIVGFFLWGGTDPGTVARSPNDPAKSGGAGVSDASDSNASEKKGANDRAEEDFSDNSGGGTPLPEDFDENAPMNGEESDDGALPPEDETEEGVDDGLSSGTNDGTNGEVGDLDGDSVESNAALDEENGSQTDEGRRFDEAFTTDSLLGTVESGKIQSLFARMEGEFEWFAVEDGFEITPAFALASVAGANNSVDVLDYCEISLKDKSQLHFDANGPRGIEIGLDYGRFLVTTRNANGAEEKIVFRLSENESVVLGPRTQAAFELYLDPDSDPAEATQLKANIYLFEGSADIVLDKDDRIEKLNAQERMFYRLEAFETVEEPEVVPVWTVSQVRKPSATLRKLNAAVRDGASVETLRELQTQGNSALFALEVLAQLYPQEGLEGMRASLLKNKSARQALVQAAFVSPLHAQGIRDALGEANYQRLLADVKKEKEDKSERPSRTKSTESPRESLKGRSRP
ncbi:MAG: hypothetical protein Q4D38_13625 [Planctomycetia bacterium]|nr:hypothetical protein [Planctomycetia bacterium]